jgi:hypothetical protein
MEGEAQHYWLTEKMVIVLEPFLLEQAFRTPIIYYQALTEFYFFK